MRLLLLSSSRVAGVAGYLDAYAEHIAAFLGAGCRAGVFVPYAGVTVGHDEYAARVAERFGEWGYALASLHGADDPAGAVLRADAVVVGGGNTFKLLADLQANGVLGAIRARVAAGMPYVGWSAGANIASPTLCTTNDMPIAMPLAFGALGLVPFQINPHYNNGLPPGHMGETRDQRLAEYLALNPQMTVVGLREGSALAVEHGQVRLLGPHTARVFRHGAEPLEIEPGDVTERVVNG
jgi:dipeptidase E